MRTFTLGEIGAGLSGSSLTGADTDVCAVTTDSRAVGLGDLFVALSGDNFDGHDYVAQAASSGACAALVSRAGEYPIPALQVADTRAALGQLGALNRQYFDGELLAITGSNGKTTVKNMLASILARVAPTLATPGNFNNEIGLPLTLLQLQPEHRYAVIEMGAARRGDIEYLCGLAHPRVAVLLNAMAAHLEGFGSQEEVARSKGEIFESLGPDGVAVINADSPFASQWRELAGAARRIEFGLEGGAAVTARDINERGLKGSQFILSTPEGDVPVRLKVAGRHNIGNALAAASAALAVNVSLLDISSGLAAVRATPGRLSKHKLGRGIRVVDDSYNANPGSVRAAIDLLAATPGRKILVLGSMAELGADSAALHREVGSYASECGIDELWLCGDDANVAAAGYGPEAHCYEDRKELAGELLAVLRPETTVLVKGSRSAAMDEVVRALLGGGED